MTQSRDTSAKPRPLPAPGEIRAYPVEDVPELRPGMSVYTDWRARR